MAIFTGDNIVFQFCFGCDAYGGFRVIMIQQAPSANAGSIFNQIDGVLLSAQAPWCHGAHADWMVSIPYTVT